MGNMLFSSNLLADYGVSRDIILDLIIFSISFISLFKSTPLSLLRLRGYYVQMSTNFIRG
jgi:hypothetical protein